jgi:transposase
VAPLQQQLTQVVPLPGRQETAARAILAEIGIERSRFRSASCLASWVGGCAGRNESAASVGRDRRARGIAPYCVFTQYAWATRTTPTYLGRIFRRLTVRSGGKKAVMAVAHKILVIVSHLRAAGALYEEDRYAHLEPRQEE